jgi:hypothetical protein
LTSAPSAQPKRTEAARARRLANTFPLDADRELLLSHAEELERDAEALDRQAASAARPALVDQRQPDQQHQQQQQQQQQGGAERPPPRSKPD